MLKRLSMVLAATAVMGICMAMMPQKVEAGKVTHKIHWIDIESGKTKIHNSEVKSFTTQQGQRDFYAEVYMGKISSGGGRKAWAKMNSGACHDRKVRVWPWSQTFHFYPVGY